MAPRETENNAYAKFGGDKQRTLWYVMVFSGVASWSQFLKGRLALTRIKILVHFCILLPVYC